MKVFFHQIYSGVDFGQYFLLSFYHELGLWLPFFPTAWLYYHKNKNKYFSRIIGWPGHVKPFPGFSQFRGTMEWEEASLDQETKGYCLLLCTWQTKRITALASPTNPAYEQTCTSIFIHTCFLLHTRQMWNKKRQGLICKILQTTKLQNTHGKEEKQKFQGKKKHFKPSCLC